jgi:hypothetical protein
MGSPGAPVDRSPGAPPVALASGLGTPAAAAPIPAGLGLFSPLPPPAWARPPPPRQSRPARPAPGGVRPACWCLLIFLSPQALSLGQLLDRCWECCWGKTSLHGHLLFIE